MLRRSIRLQQAGYYGENGNPVITYKETPHKIFGKRRRWQSHSYGRRLDPFKRLDYAQKIQTRNWKNIIVKWIPLSLTNLRYGSTFRTFCSLLRGIYFLLPLFLLAYKIAHITDMQLREAHMQLSDARMQLNYINMELRETQLQLRDTQEQLRDVQKMTEALKRLVDEFMPHSSNIPNFASESLGARVLHGRSSSTYRASGESGNTWYKMFRRQFSFDRHNGIKGPQSVIQGRSPLQTGECWPFSGERGHVFISLSHPAAISDVTLGHITKSQSPSGNIASAPRTFSVYGMTATGEEGTYLGTFMYDKEGSSFQTFSLPDKENSVFRHVKLQIESNWGHNEYTCLYSFKVHGRLPV